MIFKNSIYFILCFLFLSCNIFVPNEDEEVLLDYNVNGLSRTVDLSSVNSLDNYSKDVIKGYRTLNKLSGDLDSLALEIGLRYIDNFDYNWFDFYEDDIEYNNINTTIDVYKIIKTDDKYIYSKSDNELIITDKNEKIITKLNIFPKSIIRDIRLQNGIVTFLTEYKFDFFELYDGLFENKCFDPTLTVSEIDRKKAIENLVINIPRWRNKIIQKIFSKGKNINIELLKNTITLSSYVETDTDDIRYKTSIDGFKKITSIDINSKDFNQKDSGVFVNSSSSYIISDGPYVIIVSEGWKYSDNIWENITNFSLFKSDKIGTRPLSSAIYEGRIKDGSIFEFSNGFLNIELSIGKWEETRDVIITLNDQLEVVNKITDSNDSINEGDISLDESMSN